MLRTLKRRAQTDPSQLTLVLTNTPRDAEDMLGRLRQLGLRPEWRCRLTRNRSVMVSFDASEVRVHEGYVSAPDAVLAAIVAFVQAGSRRQRNTARRMLLSFRIETPPPVRRDGCHADDAKLAERLTEAHARLNLERFGGELRPLHVRVSRRMRARLGHYVGETAWGDPPEIAISRRHLRRHGWHEALETLLHEMVHQWQDERGMKIDHGRVFRDKARGIGIQPGARRMVA